jgi:hypothetical protein
MATRLKLLQPRLDTAEYRIGRLTAFIERQDEIIADLEKHDLSITAAMTVLLSVQNNRRLLEAERDHILETIAKAL